MDRNLGFYKSFRFHRPVIVPRIISVTLLVFLSLSSSLSSTLASDSLDLSPTTDNFIVALAYDVDTLDPALAVEGNALTITAQVYDTLVNTEPGGTAYLPGLADSWSRNSDATQWNFYLHPGITFHDGTPVDESAVVYNFNRWWDPTHPQFDANFIYFYYLFGGFKGDETCILTGVDAPGPLQVQLTFSQPTYHLLSLVSFEAFGIASPNALQTGNISTNPVGSGPFKFLEWISGDHISLTANSTYWAGAPYIDTLTFKVISDETDRYNAVVNAIVHVADNLSDSTLANSIENTAVQVKWRPSSGVGYLGINRAHVPLDHIKVRQAIAHAINWQALIGTYYTPGDRVATQFLPPPIWGYNPALAFPEYDPTLAQTLLSEAGYSAGFDTTLAYRNVIRTYLPDPVAIAAAIKGYLDAVGINTTVLEYESGEFLDKVDNGDLDLYLLGWYADYLHPDNFYAYHLCNPNSLGLGPIDPDLCADLQAALTEPDFDQQVLDYEDIAQDIHNFIPFVPIVHPRSGFLARAEVAGLVESPNMSEEYRLVSLTYTSQQIAEPEYDTSLEYVDTQINPTTVEIPAGAVTESILMRLESSTNTTISHLLVATNHAFTLEAIIDGDVQEDFTFETPVTVTIEYSDEDVAFIKDEETLLLYYWDGSAWIDAATSCDPVSAYTRDLVENRLSVDICHLSTFSLAGESYLNVFVPIINK